MIYAVNLLTATAFYSMFDTDHVFTGAALIGVISADRVSTVIACI